MPKRSAATGPPDDTPSPKRSSPRIHQAATPPEDEVPPKMVHNHRHTDSKSNSKNTAVEPQQALGSSLSPTSAENEIKADKLQTKGIEDLQSKEYINMLDVLRGLQAIGLNANGLSLPQIVVCGDQSSGKSSVLEAIAEVKFPRKANLCTRFVTQIVMRSSDKPSIFVKIIPDDKRSVAEKAKLAAFDGHISDFDEFPDLVNRASIAMGLEATGSGKQHIKAFAQDILSVEISGPGRPQLTLIDTPGIIQSATNEATEEDVNTIAKIVQDCIEPDRTIILPVVSAKNDLANQIIVRKAREVDPRGLRTMGVITKPDFLQPGSIEEKTWINVAKNQDVHFALGWHILKNRSSSQDGWSIEERDASEANFFRKDSYVRQLSDLDMGIRNLRKKLQKILFEHLTKELPKVQKQIERQHKEVVADLANLGGSRATQGERRMFLGNVANTFQKLLQQAENGEYDDAFFANADQDQNPDVGDNGRNLRAALDYKEKQFASQMTQFGHRFRIEETEKMIGTNSKAEDEREAKLNEHYGWARGLQDIKTHDQAILWVKKKLALTGGNDLPCLTNSKLVRSLFKEQMTNWADLTRAHVDQVASLCVNFITAVVQHAAGSAGDVATALLQRHLIPELQRRIQDAGDEVGRLLEDRSDGLRMYDQEFPVLYQAALAKPIQHEICNNIGKSSVGVGNAPGEPQRSYVNLKGIERSATTEPDRRNPEEVTAQHGLVAMLVYYKLDCKYFVMSVIKQVVERHLMRGLADTMLSPLKVNSFSEEEIMAIANEPTDTTRERGRLENLRRRLEEGKQAFQLHSFRVGKI